MHIPDIALHLFYFLVPLSIGCLNFNIGFVIQTLASVYRIAYNSKFQYSPFRRRTFANGSTVSATLFCDPRSVFFHAIQWNRVQHGI